MDIKVNNTSGVNKTEKKKKSQKSGSASDVSFSSMVDALSTTDATDAPKAVESKEGYGDAACGYVPQDAAERSVWMLEKLERLYADILSGEPTSAAEDLRQALATTVLDRASLPEHLRRLVDEIDVRSAVEIAKLEAHKNRS